VEVLAAVEPAPADSAAAVRSLPLIVPHDPDVAEREAALLPSGAAWAVPPPERGRRIPGPERMSEPGLQTKGLSATPSSPSRPEPATCNPMIPGSCSTAG